MSRKQVRARLLWAVAVAGVAASSFGLDDPRLFHTFVDLLNSLSAAAWGS